MKLQKMGFCVLALLCGITVHAQVKTYSGAEGYGDIAGSVFGTEKYTYIVDDSGDKIINGTYSFVGQKKMKDSRTEFVANYKLSTQIKNGFLNGTYSQAATYTGKTWSWSKGWEPFNASSSFTGIFKDGKPNGIFSYVYKDGTDFRGSATLKDGKFTGSYKYIGKGEHGAFITLAGQLTNDGKLNGQWKHKDAGRFDNTLVFQNNILISLSGENYDTPPFLQTLAKKYAAGSITEAELNAQNVYIETDSLPLDDIISYMFLDDEYGLYHNPGRYSFTDYGAVKYVRLTKLNSFTTEGFKVWINYIKENGENGYNTYEGGRCQTIPSIDNNKPYGLYSVGCSDLFAQQYTNLHNITTIYLSAAQMEEYREAIEQFYISQAQPLSTYLTSEVNQYTGNAYDVWKADHSSFEFQFFDLDTKSRKTLQSGFEKAINNLTQKVIEYIKDSTYLLMSTGYYDKMVIPNGMLQVDSILSVINHANEEYENYLTNIKTIEENNAQIIEQCHSQKVIENDYKTLCNSFDISWMGLNTNKKLSRILDQQEQYKNTIQLFDENIKRIKANTQHIQTTGKAYKHISKAYQTYIANVDLSWDGLDTNTKLDTIMKIQDIFIKALSANNAADLNKSVKKSKDKSIDAILNILK